MNARKRIRCIIRQNLLIPAVLMLFTQGFAQSQNQSSVGVRAKQDEQIIICPVFVAMVQIEVTDSQGKEVSYLRKDDFVIYEDEVKQRLDFWKRNVGTKRQADQRMYEAGYYPKDYRFRGEWRKIQIIVRGQATRKLKVEYIPKGYYAKRELRK